MTLEKLFQFIVAKEAGKRSAGRLSQSQGVDATSSQYRRAKQDDIKQHKAADSNETARQRCSCYVVRVTRECSIILNVFLNEMGKSLSKEETVSL